MKKFSEEMQNYIADNYYNKTAKELAEELDVSYGYVKKIWNIRGLKGKTNKGNSSNLIGKTYGYLTVIKKSDRRAGNGGIYWICQCSCGREDCLKEKEILGQSLKNGSTISCGAIGKEKLENGRGLNFKDLTGERFGKLQVIKRIDDKIIKNNVRLVQWQCKCDCGNLTNVLASNLKKGNTQSCGFCCENSHGNLKISKILEEANIPYEREKRFLDCKDKSYLPFDFYIDDKYLIEYDGKQHFKSEGFFDYESTHRHDLIKNQWCKDNNIPLIRIPYTHYDNLCLEDLLLETSNFIVE